MNSPVPTLFLCAAALLLPPATAQLLPEGFAASLTPLPTGAGSVHMLANNQRVWFDGSDLWLAGPGQPQRSLLRFAVPVFGSMTLEVAPGLLLFGESSTQGLWLVPLQGPAPVQPIAQVQFNYDAALWAPNEVLISAKTSGFGGPDNDIFHVDITSGNTRLLAQIPGASGPLAVAANGDVYYATASLLFPSPPGTVQVLRFPQTLVQTALANQQVLGLAQAQVVWSGLDAASTLALDDHGNLLFTDWFQRRIGVLRGIASSQPSVAVFADYASTSPGASAVQFRTGGQQGVFAPFQPANGTLYIHEAAWNSTNQIRALRPQRARLTADRSNPIPAGSFQLQVSDGPANGLAVVALALPPASSGAPLTVAGFAQPLWWDLSAATAVASFLGAFDAGGNLALGLHNPGALPPVGFLAQVAFVDAGLAVVGSTAALPLVLGQ